VNRLLPLARAIRLHVEPRMHLHFASTPSRSNAAVREVARAFLDRRPEFVLSSTGFHSSAHTLALLGLGRRYLSCFFGDNYPAPRPNALYRTLAKEEALEHWSLLTYVLALRAAALGHPYAVTTSLGRSDLGAALARAGRLFEVADPAGGSEPLRLLAPLVPDVTFVHAPLGTSSGRVLCSAPFGEGFHGALAARRGVIVTVERIVDESELDAFSALVPLPAARVLAIAEEPYGAHPQPLYTGGELPGVAGYGDDFAAYEEWRERAERPELFAQYRRQVLEAEDGRAAYLEFVGAARLEALALAARRTPLSERPTLPFDEQTSPFDRRTSPSTYRPRRAPEALGVSERLVLLAARAVARRVGLAGHTAVLAGIGQAFSAARLALLLSAAAAESVELLVETGISGFDPQGAHPFLLSAENMAAAKRLSSVEDNLGVNACGAQNRCLAVVGCAEADAFGNLNSSFVDGELIVGSGGASDLTAGAREVVVLCRSSRLVSRVEFVTSPGERVRAIVTEDAVLERSSSAEEWRLTHVGLGRSAAEICAALPFAVRAAGDERAPAPSDAELAALAAILPEAPLGSRGDGGRAHA
jgi:acyl CoA:acetate/3-ketoacid CoA transferase beta subunit/acyl CoA:acetate/3-ketoacid CoA transferase alpha subunit